jgi:hypothetical protein
MIGPVEILPVLRSESADGGLGLGSIEAWPAAGGGLLVGMAEPEFAGTAPLRRTVKTIFIRLSSGKPTTLLLPYVSLEAEAQRCIRALAAAELAVPEECIAVGSRDDDRNRVIDLGPQAERSLQACAAVTRSLLTAAAAELWGVPVHRCHVAAGLVAGPDCGQIVQLGDVAADAALADLPDSVWLFSGRTLSLRAAKPVPRPSGCTVLASREAKQYSLHT